ncbi:MAG: glycoside hydrolase family 3 C-terminal domain-containing protein [Oscillospiraceae bacterium]|nr:glycoside hydrolase family 3 C-terminal domain-containing protein [Clostridia bacterium]MBP3699823.1 glycoside hydrolase family 3 C-terminal domain-containing protein [Oscillospiraceae bacterium]
MDKKKCKSKAALAKAITAAVLAVVLLAGNIAFYLNVDAIAAHYRSLGYGEESEEAIAARESGNALAEQIEAEGAVLLKNDNNVLPLKDLKVNVFGWSGSDDGFIPMGTGSGAGARNDLVTFLGGLDEVGIQYNPKLARAYDDLNWNRVGGGSYFVEAHGDQYKDYYGVTEAPESFYTDELMEDAVAYSDTAIIVLGRLMGEGNDFSKTQYFSNQTGGGEDPNRKLQSLSAREEYMINLVCEKFENVIIITNTGNPLELGIADDPRVDAVLSMGLPGTRGTIGIAKILSGEVNPSGKLADTWAYDLSTAAAYATAGLNANKYTELGFAYTEYMENIYNGYLWYETADAEGFWSSDRAYELWGVRSYDEVVQYPFGFGLSYTTFDWELKEVNVAKGAIVSKNDTVKVTVRVTNTGEVAGRDVVELYYSAPYTPGGIEKSAIKLGGFAKTPTIEPGQFADVVIEMPIEEMKSYDCYDANNNGFMGYELEKGSYVLSFRTDVHTLKEGMTDHSLTLNVAEDVRYEVDSVTGTVVTNQFTTYKNPVSGASSTINEPFQPNAHSMDGAENEGGPIAYMTRADFVGTFPVAASPNKTGTDLLKDMHKNTKGHEPADPNVTGAPVFGSTSTKWNINDLFGVPYNNPMWDEITSQLTYEEALHFLIDGIGTIALESIDKPATKDTDGPCGFNTNMTGEDDQKAVCYPCSTVIAQTWDWYAVYQVGVAIGMEGNALGIDGWYGPGANTHRSALGGRNFEYYSEDALLSGVMCAYHCLGAKERGIQVYVKHIGPNEDDNGRNGAYKWLTEQALRENYLKPFEMAIKMGANGLMASVTRTGGMRTTGSYALQTVVVRDEWGFCGTIITDYYQSGDINDFDEGIRAGNTQVLWPDYRDDILDDTTSDTAKYYVHKSAKDMLYAYADTMFYAETAQGLENGALVGTVTQETVAVFPWWIPCMTAFNAVALAVILYLAVPKDLFRKKGPGNTEVAA